MKALRIAYKTLLEGWREPALLALLVLFPAAMLALYFVAFADPSQGLSRMLVVLVLNEDKGPAGAQLVESLRAVEFEGKPVFTVETAPGRTQAEHTLQERKAAVLVVIPAGFSESLAAFAAGGPPATVELVGDPASDLYVFAESWVGGVIDAYAKAAAGWQQTPRLGYEFLPGTGAMTDLQYGVPGTIVFGVLFVMISAAIVLVREDARGTLQRLRLTRAGAADLLVGVTLAQMAEAAVQVPVAFAAALALGFQSPGSLPLAVGIGLLLSLGATGLGLVCACFARDDGAAAGLATFFLVPLAFLSGAVFPMPPAPIATIGGRVIQVYDLMVTAPAAEAMRRVLVYGDGPAQIAYELVMTAVQSALYLAIGVLLYRRLKLR